MGRKFIETLFAGLSEEKIYVLMLYYLGVSTGLAVWRDLNYLLCRLHPLKLRIEHL